MKTSRQRCLIALAAAGILALGAGSTADAAEATSAAQSVSAATLGTLSLSVPTPVVMSGLQPGSTATGTGALVVLSTKSNWSMTVQDTATTAPGHMLAASTGCSGSAASLASPLTIQVSSLLGGVTSAGPVALSGTAQSAATATGVLGTAALVTSYSQPVSSSEALLTGCSYSISATYTLQ
jgi:hypothetical protein